jgi:hypothetical protein
MPKRGQFEFPITLVGKEVSCLLSCEEDNVLDIVEYPYTGIDWRGCPNIQFITEEPPYERGNIIIMF